jgi:hypothetical protein
MRISEAKSHLSTVVNDVFRRETRILVEKSGIAVSVILATSDLERLDRLDRQCAERTAPLEAFGAVLADVPAAEPQRDVNRIVTRVWGDAEDAGAERTAAEDHQPR